MEIALQTSSNRKGKESVDKRDFKEERTHLRYLVPMGSGKEKEKALCFQKQVPKRKERGGGES